MDAGEGYGLQGVVNGTFIYGTVICVIHALYRTQTSDNTILLCRRLVSALVSGVGDSLSEVTALLLCVWRLPLAWRRHEFTAWRASLRMSMVPFVLRPSATG